MTRLMLTITAAAAISGCVTSRGTSPHEMSAEEHQAAAVREGRLASRHRGQYDPDAWKTRDCKGMVRGEISQPCWTSVMNPTASHLEEERRHVELARGHREASQALRDAELAACAGIPETDRDVSPFAHREDIEKVERVWERREPGRAEEPRQLGAAVYYRPVPGLTAEWLQRLVDCHLARNAALGHDRPEMAFCPLALRDVRAAVRSTGKGFAVTVTSTDPRLAREILHRASALLESGKGEAR